tara:strand:- start:9137 stop:9535 length:399 start_codon:yes stop_codon:yes gene_type:complete
MTDETGLAKRLTKTYIKIRDERVKINAECSKKLDVLDEQLNTIKRALLAYCKEHGIDSVKTTEGLFYRSTKQRYWTSDWEAMYRFIQEHNVPEFMEKRLNQTTVRNFLEENPDIVPQGMNIDSEYIISVRKK